MKKIILSAEALILCFTLVFSMTSPVFANDSIRSAIQPSAAGVSISIVRSASTIPASTPMLSSGVVSDGIITYEVKVCAVVTENGVALVNQPVAWSLVTSSTTANITKYDPTTNSAGQAFATVHVRGVSTFTVSVSCNGTTQRQTLSPVQVSTYDSTFWVTYYVTSAEADYNENQTQYVATLNASFKPSFLSDVRLNGSGLALSGRYVKYYGGEYSYQEPTTASQTTPTVGRTIAVDPHYIPMVRRNGQYIRGQVTISDIGSRLAEDTGGGIEAFDIDVYCGVGLESVTEDNGYHTVVFRGTSTTNPTSLEDDFLVLEELTTYYEEPIWYSPNNRYCAYISKTDKLANRHQRALTLENLVTGDTKQFELPLCVRNIENVSFLNDDLIAIEGHVNPNLNTYDVFDIETMEPIKTFYGYGFTVVNNTLYYVQAPQHFSGVRGYNRILSSDGFLIYKSAENVIISDINVVGNTISFKEISIVEGFESVKQCSCNPSIASITSAKGDIYYY